VCDCKTLASLHPPSGLPPPDRLTLPNQHSSSSVPLPPKSTQSHVPPAFFHIRFKSLLIGFDSAPQAYRFPSIGLLFQSSGPRCTRVAPRWPHDVSEFWRSEQLHPGSFLFPIGLLLRPKRCVLRWLPGPPSLRLSYFFGNSKAIRFFPPPFCLSNRFSIYNIVLLSL